MISPICGQPPLLIDRVAAARLHLYLSSIKPFKNSEHHRRRLRAEGQPAIARYLAIEDKHYAEGRGGLDHVFEATIEFTAQDGRQIRSTGRLIASLWEKPSVGGQVHIRYNPDNPDDWTWSNEDAERDQVAQVSMSQPVVPQAGAEIAFGGVQIVNASGADPATLMEKLERLRGQGLLSDQQLEAAKLQIENGSAGISDASAAPSRIADRLHRLDQLHQQRLLSDEEYAEQRKRVLDSI